MACPNTEGRKRDAWSLLSEETDDVRDCDTLVYSAPNECTLCFRRSSSRVVVSQCFSSCFGGGGTQTDLGEERLKLVLIGLDNAGKTTLLNTLRNIEAETTPTYGFISQTIRDAGGVDIEIYDLGGGKSIRRIWCE